MAQSFYRAYDDYHLARLYDKATPHGIDRFFLQGRRRSVTGIVDTAGVTVQ